jgi:hypothetical protein
MEGLSFSTCKCYIDLMVVKSFSQPDFEWLLKLLECLRSKIGSPHFRLDLLNMVFS